MCLGIPGEVVAIYDGEGIFRTGEVAFAGVKKQVNLAYVPEVKVGDYVIVHVGFAISRIDENEVEKTFEHLSELLTDPANKN